MNSINKFFWICSGAHIGTLRKYPSEYNKFTGIGATIFFTALFASLSGGYAMYFVFSGGALAIPFSIFFGLIWGLAIFNMDRYIVSSISKKASTGKQILQATPRILLAIMIGVVISRPLELKIFDKEIREHLKISYLDAQRIRIDTLKNTFNQKYTAELSHQKDLALEKDSLEKDINRSRYQLNQEIFGDKTNQTSGKVGYGTFARQKETVLNEKTARLNAVRRELSSMDSTMNNYRQTNGINSERLLSNRQLDSLTRVAGFADRNSALGKLSLHADGSRDDATYWAVTFIALLFVLFECLPVLVKLMSDRGPYDMALAYVEEAATYGAVKEKESMFSVHDQVQDTRIEAYAERERKRILDDAEEPL